MRKKQKEKKKIMLLTCCCVFNKVQGAVKGNGFDRPDKRCVKTEARSTFKVAPNLTGGSAQKPGFFLFPSWLAGIEHTLAGYLSKRKRNIGDK